MNIEALRKACDEATVACWEITSVYDNRKRELYAEADRKVREELGLSLDAAQAARNKAENELHAAEDAERLASASSKLPYPEGTVLCKWERIRWSFDGMKLTGEIGVIEIYKEGDPYPVNRNWGRPRPGDIVIRLLKRNGSKSITAEKWDERMRDCWLPKGMEHPSRKV